MLKENTNINILRQLREGITWSIPNLKHFYILPPKYHSITEPACIYKWYVTICITHTIINKRIYHHVLFRSHMQIWTLILKREIKMQHTGQYNSED